MFIWLWLVLCKGWFNFSKDVLVVLLVWPAGLTHRVPVLPSYRPQSVDLCTANQLTGFCMRATLALNRLNTSLIYGGLVLLQNLNNIELIICLKWLFMGSHLICLNSFCPICTLLFKFRQNCMHLFWSICNCDFNLLFKLGCQAEQSLSKWGCIRA